MSRLIYVRIVLLTITLMACALENISLQAREPMDVIWSTNATLENVKTLTMPGLGAMQGVSFYNDKVYLYGDVWDVKPRVGVIREYTRDYKPTGRVVWLSKNGKPLLRHPTGLTWHPRWGTFLGDTVDQKGIIYRFDWEQAWKDGNFDRAVQDVIEDDAAVNGCRPEFVTLAGKDFLATADYGDVRPEVRLYDPKPMLLTKRTSAPGVVAYRVLCGPFNQNLHWDAAKRQLTCVQNVVAGRGWRLDILDLAKATAAGRASEAGVRVRMLTFPPRDELEGYRPLSEDRGLFVTSNREGNLVLAQMKELQKR